MAWVLAISSFFVGWGFASFVMAFRRALRSEPNMSEAIEAVIMFAVALALSAGFA